MLTRFIEDDPLAWVTFLGFKATTAEMLDGDLSVRFERDGSITYCGKAGMKRTAIEMPVAKTSADPCSLGTLREQVALDTAASIIDRDPTAWAGFLGYSGEARIVKMPKTMELIADHLVRISFSGKKTIIHIDVVAEASKANFYDILPEHLGALSKYKLKGHTMIVVLRPSAEVLTGFHDDGSVSLKYWVFQFWDRTPEEVLSGSPVLYPFLALTNVAVSDLPSYIRRMQELVACLPKDYQHEIWMRTRVLTGLLYTVEETNNYLNGVCSMPDLRESSTYREIIDAGRVEGKVELVTKLLRSRFEPLPEQITTSLKDLSAVQLDDLAVSFVLMSNLTDVARWISSQTAASS